MPTSKRKKSVNSQSAKTRSRRHPAVVNVVPRTAATQTTILSSLSPIKVAGLVVVGCLLLMTGFFYFLYSQTVLSFKVSPTVVGTAHLKNAYPAEISIESAKIKTAIVPTTIKDGIWEVAQDKAAFLESSSTPAEGGNVIIYGHNRRNLFQSLHKTKVGDKIKIKTGSNLVFEYQVKEIKVVDPSDIEEVIPTDFEVLTVYTCTGLFDSKRLVVKAFPVQVTPV